MVFGIGNKLIVAPKLLERSLKFYKQHIRALLLVGLVAEIVNILLGIVVIDNDVIKALWFALFVGPAFLVAIKRLDKGEKKLSVKQTYYDAGAFALPFFLTLLVMSLATIPFSLGALIFSIAQVSFVISTVEQAVLFGLWAIFAIPTVVLLVRYIFAQVEVVTAKARPAAALARSGAITKGKFKPMLVRLGMIGIIGFVFLALVMLATSPLSLSETLALIVLEIALYLVVIPIGYTYLYLLHKELS